MQKIKNKIKENLLKKGIVEYEPVFVNKYTNIEFKVKHPVTDEVIDTYNFNLRDFNKLNYKERAKYKSLSKTEVFNEDDYLKEKRKQDKILKTYEIEYEKEYPIILEEMNINEKEIESFKKMISFLNEYNFDFDFNGYQDRDKANLEFENELINIIKDK